MTPIPIKERETEEYAMNHPTMLKVNIASGKILVDKRSEHFGIHAPVKGERHGKR